MTLALSALLWLAVGSLPLARAPVNDWNVKQMREGLNAFAKCVVRQKRDIARDHVLNGRSWPVAPNDVLDFCLMSTVGGGTTLRLPPPTLAYGLADALVRNDFASGLPNVVDKPELDTTPQKLDPEAVRWRSNPHNAAKVAAADDRDRVSAYLMKVGECVVRAGPQQTYDLLMTEPASAAETATMPAVIALLPRCIDATSKLTMNRMALRGSVAVAFYRLANAPVVAKAAG